MFLIPILFAFFVNVGDKLGWRAFLSMFTNKLPSVWSFLSESYDQFKLNIHNLFPVLIDTKNVTKDIWKVMNGTALG